MEAKETGVLLCDGTDCGELSIGSFHDSKEVPAWRHPSDRKMDRVFEFVRTVNYCANHEADARAVIASSLKG